MNGFPQGVVISAPDWPEACGEPRPGNLTAFVPQGFGLGAPPVITPYGGAPPGGAYGFDTRQGQPFLDAPLSESAGGTLYLDDGADVGSIRGALQIMGVYDTADYVAFAGSSESPVSDRYLDQMRFVTHFALTSLFRARPKSAPTAQTATVIEAALAFIAEQKVKWNDPRYAFSVRLAGSAGGDGDWAKESLAFGFHVENTYWGVYRLWSRPWLVTK